MQRLLAHQALGFRVSLLLRQRAEVDERHLQHDVLLDALDGLTLVNGEVSAQHLVALHQRAEGQEQRV